MPVGFKPLEPDSSSTSHSANLSKLQIDKIRNRRQTQHVRQDREKKTISTNTSATATGGVEISVLHRRVPKNVPSLQLQKGPVNVKVDVEIRPSGAGAGRLQRSQRTQPSQTKQQKNTRNSGGSLPQIGRTFPGNNDEGRRGSKSLPELPGNQQNSSSWDNGAGAEGQKKEVPRKSSSDPNNNLRNSAGQELNFGGESGTNLEQGQQRQTFDNNPDNGYQGQGDGANSSCTSLKNCCCPVCQGVYGNDDTYCQEPCGPPCSEKPGCHTLREDRRFDMKHRIAGLDHFPNPFRMPKVYQPDWLAYAGIVLRFYAYYQEPIPESRNENYRIHQCEIRYFMEDGSIEVYEPKTFDPGFPQGMIIRKNRIPLPPPCDPAYCFYTVDHLNVGCEVEFYGKLFLICGVDGNTRQFLNRKLGISVPDNIEMPIDIYTELRKDSIVSLFARRAWVNVEQDKLKRYLTNSGKVLRFWAYWDDRCHGGDLKQFLVHYFLEDETIEIKEITDPQGRIRGAVTFLGRGKLYKDFKELVTLPGATEEAELILNTTSTSAKPNEHVFMPDRLCPGVNYRECVKDNDLAIGAVLNVYGRAFILTSCDKATEVYYRQKYGVTDFTPLELTGSDVPGPFPRMETPPHIGIGDEEDTLHNWDRLQLEPPKKDQLVLLVKDKDILGFDARFYNALHKVNADRRFVLTVYMVDDTIAIFEKPHRNTGLRGGMFLSRSRVRKNPSPRFELGEVSEYYLPRDYFVGNILDLNGFKFLLTSANEFTLSYMEANSHVFPQASLCVILEKVREAFGPIESEAILQCFSERDECLNGIVSASDFRDKLMCITKGALSEHEVITLQRAFKVQASTPPPDMSTLQKVIQTEMQRHQFDIHLLRRVEYTLRNYDPCKLGLVDRDVLRTVLKGAKLPVHRQIVDFLADNFESADECGRVNYCCVMKYLDYIGNCAGSALPSHERCVMKWIEPKPPYKIYCVNYRAFLETVCPNFRCAIPSVCCPQENNCAPCPEEEFPRPCPPCCNEPDPRDLAGVVISDNRIRSEEMRCQDEDMGCCPADACPYPQHVGWSSRNFEDDCCMLNAYDVPVPTDCTPAEAGNRELYRPGDFIGPDDVYGYGNRTRCE